MEYDFPKTTCKLLCQMLEPSGQIEPKLLVYIFDYRTTVTNETLVQNQYGINTLWTGNEDFRF
jgi:hypothetical protein